MMKTVTMHACVRPYSQKPAPCRHKRLIPSVIYLYFPGVARDVCVCEADCEYRLPVEIPAEKAKLSLHIDKEDKDK